MVAGLACRVLPIAAAATWIDLRVTSTSGCVDAVAPLSDNADIQHAAVSSIRSALLDAVALGDSDAATDAVGPAVEKVVGSHAFASAWKSSNRAAHQQVIAVLADDDSGVIADDGTVGVDFGDLLDPVIDDLSDGAIPTDGLDDVSLSVDVVALLARATLGRPTA